MTFDPFKPFEWQLGHGASLTLGPQGILMGVLNVTPDSFSDGGRHLDLEAAVKQALRMHRAGAQIIDIGGESTRPGADPVDARTEQARILPVLEALAGQSGMILSVDTWRADTAAKAVLAGAHIINDVWGFQKDPEIAKIAASTRSGCVIMHTGRERSRDPDVIADQIGFLEKSLKIAMSAGVPPEAVILDPGFGFAKDSDENVELLARMDELLVLGFHLLTGTSRKRFVGSVTGRSASRRDVGTAATTVVARMKGSAVFRVHDVPKNRDALRMADAVLQAERTSRRR